MKLLALAVLLSVVQASPPVTRKAPDNPTQAASNVKSKSAPDQTPTQAAPTPNKTDGNGPTKSDSGEQHPDNDRNSIVIRQLPAVTVNGPRRDWADWGSWIFNLLLVGVGVAGIIIAVCTLKNISRQTELLGEYVTATKQMAVATRRPKLEVKHVFLLPDKTITGRQEDGDEWRIGCVIANIGGSKAA